jgi:large subunit ribosomal protein L18
MAKTNIRLSARRRRKKQIRKKLSGTTERPRLSVFRSTKHIYVQLIDDTPQPGRKGAVTIAAATTLSPEMKDHEGHNGNRSAAAVVGTLIAQKAQAAGIKSVVFDRNGYLFHGRVKALADAAREAGLDF